MLARHAPIWLLVGTLAGATACAPPARVLYQEQVQQTPAPARHAVHSARLEQLMRSLQEQWIARMPQAMDMELERERRLDDLIQVLRSMAESAQRIDSVARNLALDPTERGEFSRLVVLLQERTNRLADEAPRLSPDALRAGAQQIERTCAECHRRFRIPRDPDG